MRVAIIFAGAAVGLAAVSLSGCARSVSAQGETRGPRRRADVAQATASQPPSYLNRPAASRAFESWTLREAAEDALARIGPSAVPELQRWLRDPNPAIRREAADMLARIGPEASSAVPDLIILLDDEDADVRKYSARALGQIGAAASPAAPSLMRVLREEVIKEQTRDSNATRR